MPDRPPAAWTGEARAAARTTATDEVEIGARLRVAKGRVALLTAVAEISGRWTTAQSTAALSDLADAALDAGLRLLLKRAFEKGDLVRETAAKESGLALFAL